MTNEIFKSRYIRVVIGIGEGIRGDQTPSEFWTLDDHRVSATIQAYGGETQGTAQVKIFGMTLSEMNKLTAMGPVMYQLRGANSIQIFAGDDLNSLSTIYFGTIMEAIADFNSAPDVAMNITAQSAAIAAMMPAQDYHYDGIISAAKVLEYLAGKLKWEFQNLDIGAGNMGGTGGLDVLCVDPTYTGSYLEQIKQCVEEHKNEMDYAQEYKSTTSILKIKHRWSVYPSPEQIVSPYTNMIGYPVFCQSNMLLKFIFMPTVNIGGKITVKDSIVVPANRDWNVHSVTHELESMTPGGKWETTCGVMPSDFIKQ